ncbi:type IIG restriction enzyme/methyltransferase [Helicobacter mesocricetorum]
MYRGGGANTLDENAKEARENISLESKAFYESILYFLREFLTHKNNNISFIILTNTQDFYCVDASEYVAFAKDKLILKAFKNCENKEGNDASTKRFYEEVKNLLPSLDMELKYTHFRLEDCQTNSPSCHSERSEESQQSKRDVSALPQHDKIPPNKREISTNAQYDKQTILPLLYQILSPQVLLKRKTYLDANTLNQDFYNELLHILGLEEISQGGKILILPSQTQNTFLDSICSAFGLNRDKDFEILFSLLTTWNNRLLFLRLLESMLLSFNHIQKPFLGLEALKDFQALNTLFFDILAKIEESRDKNLPKALESIPYLNSSLFEKTPLEREGKEIKLLQSKPLMLYADSILYKDKNFCQSLQLNDKAKDSTLPLLEYLFAFLHTYDFTTTAGDIENHTKINFDKLINSAVLGLVFEKLNGYKEGSFYTPSFITRYMCKQSLERVVLQKFNESQNWDCHNLEELKNKIDKLTDNQEGYKKANEVFDSIHICDPAVGSGHFLVSALNELILLKFKLGILCDETYQRIKDITLEILRDEIVIRDSHNALFTYTLPAHENIESHKIQRALFFAKRKLIESCLFGVDINPNSCEITKLRLWIELLKYSYYKDIPNKRLETLPNIDINIKCGNSLISRFSLDDSLKAIPNINFQIQQYKKLVFDYKNADQNLMKISKAEIEAQIEAIKQTFTLTLKDPKTKRELEKAIESHIKQFNDYLLDDKALLEGLGSLQFNLFGTPTLSEEEQERALQSYGKIQALRKKLTLALSGAEYKNAFEWRFAFPEVLDNNGDFLGFDLVIGNPPYIKEPDNKKLFDGTRHLRTYQGKMDIWYHFVGRGFDIVKNQGIVTFIATNNWTTNAGAKNLRNVILKESQILNLVDFGSYMCFDSASIQTMIMEFQKLDSIPQNYQIHYARIDSKKPTDKHRDAILKRESFKDNIYLEPSITPSQMLDKSLTFADSQQEEVLNKILQNGKMFLKDNEAQIGIGLTDKVKKKMGLVNYEIGAGIFQISTKELESLHLTKDELKLIKPLYTSNELFRFYANPNNSEWVIYTDSSFKNPNSMDKYPNLKKHLDKFRDVITSDNKPYGLHRAKQEHFFNKTPSIVSLRKCPNKPIFTYVDFDCYVTSTFFIIKTDRINLKFLTGLFNSKLIAFWLRHKGKMQGNHYQIDKEPLLNIPLIEITKSNQKIVDRIIALVDEILTIKESCQRDVSLSMKAQHDKQDSDCHSEPALAGEESLGKESRGSKRDVSAFAKPQHDKIPNTSTLESQIDSLVYQLYNLTNEEIRLVES